MAHKNRHSETIQRVTTSFKHVEKKLDKLQNDLNYHGQTLSDLRLMVMNLSTGMVAPPVAQSGENVKRAPKRTMAIQYDVKYFTAQETKLDKKQSTEYEAGKTKKAPIPYKMKTTSAHSQKRSSHIITPFESQMSKLEANQKHAQRHRKAEANRKGLVKRSVEKRQKKATEKKASKINT